MRRIVFTLLCLATVSVWAAEWTIGPNGDFANINTAMNDDRVADGDVLQILEGTNIPYAYNKPEIVSKAVTIRGNGFESNSKGFVSQIAIESDGVCIKQLVTQSIYIRASEVTIEHCLANSIEGNDPNYYIDDVTIRGCRVYWCIKGQNDDSQEGWTVENNILINTNYLGASLQNLYNAKINHNLFVGYDNTYSDLYLVSDVKNSEFTNNIIIHPHFNDDLNSNTTNTATKFEYNIISSTLSKWPNNLFGKALSDICICEGNQTDASYYKLKENSIALGYANDGGDCGPWSGSHPFWINGVDPLSAPLSGTATLDLNKADNQAAGIYQTLLSLFTTIGSNGMGGNLDVSVATGTYYFTISDATFPILQALAAQLATGTGQLSMTSANGGTIFNFQIDQTFLMKHASDLMTILEQVQASLQQITLVGIKVYLNGNIIINEDFQVEPNDLLALKNMYQAWGGETWTAKQWSFESNGRRKEDFPGVTFNDEGRVTAIDLENNGLAGSPFDITPVQLTEVTSLNLSRNQLTGDVSRIVHTMTKLKYLNLSYNRLTLLSEPSAIACTSPNLRFQNRVWTQGTETDLPFVFAGLEPMMIPVQRTALSLSFPSLLTYDYEKLIYLKDISTPATTYADIYSYSELTPNTQYCIYRLAQDFPVALVFGYGTYNAFESAYPAILHYAVGDADMTGETNVLDVQYTLNYILAPSTITYFNYSAANTYADEQINVQDIVATVNVLLDQPSLSRTARVGADPVAARTDDNAADGEVYTSNGCLMLRSVKAVAALDIELQGVAADQVSLLLNHRDFQMIGRDTEGGSRFVIFSPTGKSLPTYEDIAILRMATAAAPVAVDCSDSEAQRMALAIASATTGIANVVDVTDHPVYDLQGRRADGRSTKGIYIRNGKKIVVR